MEVEAAIGRSFPPDFATSYTVHDGQSESELGLIYGWPLLPLHAVYEHWARWGRLDFDDEEQTRDAWVSVDFIAERYTDIAWVPFSHDGGGNHIGIDLAPPLGGTAGQVINFGRDEDLKLALAPSFAHFLERIADDMESGALRVFQGELKLTQDVHFVEWFGEERVAPAHRWSSLVRHEIPKAVNAGDPRSASSMAREALTLAKTVFPAGHPHLEVTQRLVAKLTGASK